ncbi:MAG: zinc ribbon domain-containing protein [Candidatus Omnitrophica bacterium]|nr:zinc ribbon domain-containing protein [Candidatus Omnitrophota bacterium]
MPPPKQKGTLSLLPALSVAPNAAHSITAEEKLRPLKNGGANYYTYYRCTRRIKRDCSEPPVRLDDLENQIREVIGKITIPPQFRDWAIKQLKEEQSREIVDRDEITKAHRHNLDACVKKIDALFNMRLNEEISPEEYTTKKDDLLKEKQKYEELIGDTQKRVETWLDRADKAFIFAQTAPQRFNAGTLEDKRYVLSCLGSNLVLSGRKLRFQVDDCLALFEQVASDVQSLHNRLEPAQLADSITDWEALYAQNKKWGGGVNLPQTGQKERQRAGSACLLFKIRKSVRSSRMRS